MTTRKKSPISAGVAALLLILAAFVSPSAAPIPCIDVEKSVTPDVSKVGDEVIYEICVTNCGDTLLTMVEVWDLTFGLTFLPFELAPGGVWCEDFGYVIQPGDPDPLVNDVYAFGIDESGILVEDSNDAVVDLVEPDIDLEKTVEPTEACPGDTVIYTICIENTGDWDLENVEVEDPLLSPIYGSPLPGFPSVLAPGEVSCVDFPYVVPEDVPTCPDLLENCAMVTSNPVGLPNVIDANDCADICCPEDPVGGGGCRLTGGGVDEEYSPDGVTAQDYDSDRATFGGQAGANTALPPQPKGEWTHTQQRGPSGSFTFHGGTASAPAGTEIIEIRCSDPGGCTPSGDPPSPAKQLDFDGVGTFKNFGTKGRAPVWLFPGATAKAGSKKGGKFRFDGTFHYFQVNADDLGEPGNKNLDSTSDPDVCPPNGFGEKGDLPLGDCQCADFYRITIYDGVNAADVVWLDDENIDPTSLNTVDVIYEFHGYIDGGNLQIHHLTGYDMNLTDNGLAGLNELAANWLEGV